MNILEFIIALFMCFGYNPLQIATISSISYNFM